MGHDVILLSASDSCMLRWALFPQIIGGGSNVAGSALGRAELIVQIHVCIRRIGEYLMTRSESSQCDTVSVTCSFVPQVGRENLGFGTDTGMSVEG